MEFALRPGSGLSLEALVVALEAAGESTRLRLIALLAEGELTVTEVTSILGQSQPRVSRHLKLLADAGLVSRHREGAWAFFRIRTEGAAADLVAAVLAARDLDDPVFAEDRRRLAAIRADRAEVAAAYFAAHAAEWDSIRRLHVADGRVEAAVLAALPAGAIGSVLDLGTGTGRMLELLGARVNRLVGVDVNPAMLAVARANLERAGLRGVQLRQADVYALPADLGVFDVVIIHQVLHFLDDPARAVREVARLLRPGGVMVVVDFAPHGFEDFRLNHAHRRLGFAAEELAQVMGEAGLSLPDVVRLDPEAGDGARLGILVAAAKAQPDVAAPLRPAGPLHSATPTREVA